MLVESSIISRTAKGLVVRLLSAAVLLWSAYIVEGRTQSAQPPGKANKTAAEIKHKFEDALAAYRNQQYAKAESELTPLLASTPESFEVNELAGLVFVAESEYAKADRYLARAVQLRPHVAEARTAFATNLLRLQKTGEAEKQFREAERLDPRNYDPNHNLGEFYIQAGDISSAIPFLKRAQEIEPTAYNNGYDLALAYERTGKLGEARLQLQQLITSRDSAEIHSLLGEVEEKSGNYVASAGQYEQAARMEPNEENILNWGSEFLLHQTFEPAVQIFQSGLTRFPKSARLLDGLGIALYGLDHLDDAARSFFRASDLNPSDPLPVTFAGTAYDNLSPPIAAEARSRFQSFLKADANNAAVRYYYAMCLWKINEKEPQPELPGQIESLLKRSLEIDPEYADAHTLLGTLYFREQRYPEAIAEYDRALETNPNDASVLYHLAQSLRRTGDKARADQELATFERLRQQQQDRANERRSEIKLFLYTMRNANSGGGPK
jgi:tetratricopeptide (TPR) repeat protein